ncbi:hypothetical protein Acy02nite_57290 [Actinoplanes cyaneus]|uniref:Uncharacterized protein n=1 Tax=Actinoplanes cyaneus TaxID=52696 RepID=A0A919ILZ9_9ACTN|nr:hypothetical protein Acy02nite_57290 [Actinoplanes cyaneus]
MVDSIQYDSCVPDNMAALYPPVIAANRMPPCTLVPSADQGTAATIPGVGTGRSLMNLGDRPT